MTILESLSLYPALKEKKNIGRKGLIQFPLELTGEVLGLLSLPSVDHLGGVARRARGEEGAADCPSKPTGGRGSPHTLRGQTGS